MLLSSSLISVPGAAHFVKRGFLRKSSWCWSQKGDVALTCCESIRGQPIQAITCNLAQKSSRTRWAGKTDTRHVINGTMRCSIRDACCSPRSKLNWLLLMRYRQYRQNVLYRTLHGQIFFLCITSCLCIISLQVIPAPLFRWFILDAMARQLAAVHAILPWRFWPWRQNLRELWLAQAWKRTRGALEGQHWRMLLWIQAAYSGDNGTLGDYHWHLSNLCLVPLLLIRNPEAISVESNRAMVKAGAGKKASYHVLPFLYQGAGRTKFNQRIAAKEILGTAKMNQRFHQIDRNKLCPTCKSSKCPCNFLRAALRKPWQSKAEQWQAAPVPEASCRSKVCNVCK